MFIIKMFVFRMFCLSWKLISIFGDRFELRQGLSPAGFRVRLSVCFHVDVILNIWSWRSVGNFLRFQRDYLNRHPHRRCHVFFTVQEPNRVRKVFTLIFQCCRAKLTSYSRTDSILSTLIQYTVGTGMLTRYARVSVGIDVLNLTRQTLVQRR
jgi:hypothetical protein